MSKKLQALIVRVVLQAGSDDGCSSIPSELVAAATRAALEITDEDIAKFPDLWYPTVSAKSAGGLKWKEGWGRLWFEALVEILYQAGPRGIPTLVELLDREIKSYHALVFVRLLRLAAADVQKKQILEKLKTRLPTLKVRAGPECVEEAMLWAAHDNPRLAKLLKSMAKLPVQGIGKETVGSVMKEWAESRAVRL